MLRPLMPMIRTNLGLSYTQVGVVMSVFSITSGLSQLPAGWLTDHIQPRLVVVFGVSGVALAGFLIGLSNSYMALLLLLVLAAILGGGYHPASITSISSSVSPEYRGRALGLHLVGGTSAFWVVPLLAAPIAVAWGWRSSYLILSVPTIILGILLYILIGTRQRAQASQSPELGSDVVKAPVRFHWRQLVPFILISVAMGTMIQSVLSYLSLFAVDSLGVSEAAAAMLMAITPGVGLVAAPLGGYFSDRFGSVPVLLVISFLAIPLIYLLGFAPSVAALVVLMASIGVVSNMRMPISESYIAGNTPQHRRATVLGFYFFASTEVSGLLTPVVGILIDRFGFSTSFAIAGVAVAVIVLIGSVFLWRNRADEGLNR